MLTQVFNPTRTESALLATIALIIAAFITVFFAAAGTDRNLIITLSTLIGTLPLTLLYFYLKSL